MEKSFALASPRIVKERWLFLPQNLQKGTRTIVQNQSGVLIKKRPDECEYEIYENHYEFLLIVQVIISKQKRTLSMGNDLHLLFLAMMFWAAGYFSPGGESGIPLKLLKTYVLLPKWVNGFLRKRNSNYLPDGVISTSALGVQLGAYLIVLIFIGYKLNFAFLENFLFRVYGWMLCIFLGMVLSVIIGRFRPFNFK